MYVSPESAQGGEWLQGHGESQEPCGARQGDGPEGSLPPLVLDLRSATDPRWGLLPLKPAVTAISGKKQEVLLHWSPMFCPRYTARRRAVSVVHVPDASAFLSRACASLALRSTSA